MAGSSRGAPGGTPRPPEAGLLLAGDVDGVGLVPRLGVARFQFAELRFDGLAGEPGLGHDVDPLPHDGLGQPVGFGVVGIREDMQRAAHVGDPRSGFRTASFPRTP